MDEKKRQRNTLALLIPFTFAFGLILTKAFYIQVFSRGKLIDYAKKQFIREATLYPNRGNILDRNGHPLALNIQTYSLFTIPKNLSGTSKTIKRLGKIIPQIDEKKLLKKIRARKRYTWIARKISLSEQQVLKIKKMKGIYIESVPKRVYPNKDLASQIIGFVGIDNKGLSGIEYKFDEELKGRPRKIKYIQDAKGRPLKYEAPQMGVESEDVILSIDKDIQSKAQDILQRAVEKHEAASGGLAVINPENGEILAMANYPSFDSNKPGSVPGVQRKLSFISDPFEPGSTFKAITVATALDKNIARPDTNYYCERGEFEVDGHIISEADSKKKHEWLSVEDILKYSSNIGTTKLAFDIGAAKMREGIRSFGLYSKTGIEIPGESRGISDEGRELSSLALSNISFGQRIAVTGLQMLQAYAVIANDGKWVRPTILKREDDLVEGQQVISKQTAREVQRMLEKVVSEGTGKAARVKHFKIAGKTSTAQRIDKKSGGYKGHISGFIGMPLGPKKKFVISAYIDNPTVNGHYGGPVAGPMFKELAEFILLREKDFSAEKFAKISNSKWSIKDLRPKVRKIEKGVVPDFVGLDKKSASRLAVKLGLEVKASGAGLVSSQGPTAGEGLPKDKSVQLIFSIPRYGPEKVRR